jgi:hypothetical protein
MGAFIGGTNIGIISEKLCKLVHDVIALEFGERRCGSRMRQIVERGKGSSVAESGLGGDHGG